MIFMGAAKFAATATLTSAAKESCAHARGIKQNTNLFSQEGFIKTFDMQQLEIGFYTLFYL
jgi:hypothetical protein